MFKLRDNVVEQNENSNLNLNSLMFVAITIERTTYLVETCYNKVYINWLEIYKENIKNKKKLI